MGESREGGPGGPDLMLESGLKTAVNALGDVIGAAPDAIVNMGGSFITGILFIG